MPKRILIFLTLMVLTISGISIYAQQNNTTNGYTAQNNKIYANNQEIKLNGLSWSGSEGPSLAPDGLWKRNYKDLITQIKSTGFNAVRFPFCPSTLKNLPTQFVNYIANPTLNGKNSLDIMDIILDEFKNQQIYILTDHHRPDCQKISDLWYTDTYTEKNWIDDLAFVANRYKSNPYFMGLDIKNEPHGKATWGNTNPKTDFNIAAQKAAKVLYDVNPNILIFVEGIANSSSCDAPLEKWWGGNLSPMNCVPFDYTGLNSNKIVFSPHVYGPDVYNQEYLTGNLKAKMPAIWDSHFGFLTKTNQTIVPGEFGGFYKAGSKDREWQDAIIDYFIDKKICSTFYWALNPNSDDTGGILLDDWVTVNTDKVTNLKRLYKACNPLYSTSPVVTQAVTMDASKVTAKFAILDSGDWGYCGDFKITNTNLVPAKISRLGFDGYIKPKEIWNGVLQKTKFSSKWYMVPNKEWNKSIEANSVGTMGFCSTTPINNLTTIKNIKVESK